MYKLSIPKEYILEEDAHYDEIKFRFHLKACLMFKSLKSIYEHGDKLFTSFFIEKEHKEKALDILRYVMDKEETSSTITVKRLIRGLYDAGFFG